MSALQKAPALTFCQAWEEWIWDYFRFLAIYPQLQPVSVRYTAIHIFDLSLQSSPPRERSIPWSLSPGICRVWPKLGEEMVVKDSTLCKVWMVQSFKVPSGAVKGWEMLQLCWQCREGSQSLLPSPLYVPGHWCCSNLSGAGEGLRYCLAAVRATSLPAPLQPIALEFPSAPSLPGARPHR